MKRKTLKNTRIPFPFIDFLLPIFIRKSKSFSIIKEFNFSDSAIYHFDDDDQWDVNKLFGFSIGFHHDNSYRFGWRPNKDLTKIEIVGYEYIDKIRVPTIPIWEVELNKWYKYELKYNAVLGQIEYLVTGNNEYRGIVHPITIKLNWGYKLFLYFGGNKKAPHDITIYKK